MINWFGNQISELRHSSPLRFFGWLLCVSVFCYGFSTSDSSSVALGLSQCVGPEPFCQWVAKNSWIQLTALDVALQVISVTTALFFISYRLMMLAWLGTFCLFLLVTFKALIDVSQVSTYVFYLWIFLFVLVFWSRKKQTLFILIPSLMMLSALSKTTNDWLNGLILSDHVPTALSLVSWLSLTICIIEGSGLLLALSFRRMWKVSLFAALIATEVLLGIYIDPFVSLLFVGATFYVIFESRVTADEFGRIQYRSFERPEPSPFWPYLALLLVVGYGVSKKMYLEPQNLTLLAKPAPVEITRSCVVQWIGSTPSDLSQGDFSIDNCDENHLAKSVATLCESHSLDRIEYFIARSVGTRFDGYSVKTQNCGGPHAN